MLPRALPLLLLLATPLGPHRAAAFGARPGAQERPPVELSVAPATGELTVRLGDLLGASGVTGALHSGIPVRIRVVAELWRDRFFDSEEGRAEWRATAVYEPLERTYRVHWSGSASEEQAVATLEEASLALQRTLPIPLRPERAGRYYYITHVEVETLSLSDLEELGRWLRGDLAPAVAGDENVEGALARGLRRLLVRVLGLPTRRIRARTPTFEVGG